MSPIFTVQCALLAAARAIPIAVTRGSSIAARCGGDKADRLVIDPLHKMRLAVLPRIEAGMLGPSVRVALALDADEHGRRCVSMRLGVAAILMLADGPAVTDVLVKGGVAQAMRRGALVVDMS